MQVRVRVCAIAASLVLYSVFLGAQAPNMSGTWVVDRDKTIALMPAPAGGGTGGSVTAGGVGNGVRAGGGGGGAMVGGGGTPEWTITQTAAALTIVRPGPDGCEQKIVYKLDGSESVNVNGRVTQKTKTTVAGGKIVTTGTQTVATDQGDVTSDFKEVRSLDKEGAMIVETTRVVNGNARTVTTAHKKKA
jgi:hypothetical protein